MPKSSNSAVDAVFKTKSGHDTSTLEGYRAAIRSSDQIPFHQLNPNAHIEKLTPEDIHYAIGKSIDSDASGESTESLIRTLDTKLTPDHIAHVQEKALGHKFFGARRDAIRHPKATAEHISQALGDEDKNVRRAAIEHPKATAEHISQALGDEDEYVRAAAVYHPKATAEHISQALGDEDTNVRRAAIYHPKATAEHISQALGDEDEYVRAAAIAHPKATAEHIPQALGDEDKSVRAWAIRHPKATAEHISQALGDEDKNVRRAAIDHPKVTAEHISQALGDEDEYVRRAAIEHPKFNQEHADMAQKLALDNPGIKRKIIDALKPTGFYSDPTQVSFGLGTHKLRIARDLSEEVPDQKIHKKDLEAKGLSPQALKIQHLQDSKGHIHKDSIQKEIDARSNQHKFGVSESTYGEDNFNGPDNTAYQKKLEEAEQKHLENFSASDYGVHREDFIDEDRARSKHMEAFNPEDYGVSEKAHTDENGNLDEETYNEEYQNAEDDHLANFNPADYANDDDVIDHRKYENAEHSAMEDHMNQFDPSDYDLGGEDDKDEADLAAQERNDQRHTHEPSKVFQMNLTSDHAKKLKEAGVWDTFQQMNADSQNSSHPASQGNGIGWVRYTERPDGIHMDEIQSDLGQDFVKQAQAQAKGAVQSGQMSQEQADEALKETEKKYPPEHYKKISEILFGGEHPNDLLHEAFLQHLRNQGKAGTPVHLWQADTKADLAGQDADRALPAHMQRTYDQVPKKMGYETGKYGELATQHASNLQGQPTWKMRLRKSVAQARERLRKLKKITRPPSGV